MQSNTMSRKASYHFYFDKGTSFKRIWSIIMITFFFLNKSVHMLQKITKRAVDQNNKNNNFETMLEYATNKAHNLLVQISNNVSPHPRLSKGFKIKVAQRRRVSMPEVIQWVAWCRIVVQRRGVAMLEIILMGRMVSHGRSKERGCNARSYPMVSHGRSKERGFYARSYPNGRIVAQRRRISMLEVIQWVAWSFKGEGFQCYKLSNGSHSRSKERRFNARSFPMGPMVAQRREVSMPEAI